MNKYFLIILFWCFPISISYSQEIYWKNKELPLVIEFADKSKNLSMYMVFLNYKDSVVQILFVEENMNEKHKNLDVMSFDNYIKSLPLSDSLKFAFIVIKEQKYYSTYDGTKRNYPNKNKITIIRNENGNVSKELFFNKEVFLINTMYNYSRYYFLD